MARGWESKSIESQIDDVLRKPVLSQATPLTEEERQIQIKRNNLVLSRTRVFEELQHTQNPRFCQQLEKEIAFLDKQIAELTH